MMTLYAMIINLHDCVGCGACEIACKVENDVPTGVFLSTHLTSTEGRFPNPTYRYRPVMCNHCEKAACVHACPTGAMQKDGYGLTVHDPERCIACQACAHACPYGCITPVGETSAAQLAAVPDLIEGATAAGSELLERAGGALPTHDPALDAHGLPNTRPHGPQKCQMCKHLVYEGGLPRCVEACPAGARIFGNQEDIYGDIHRLLLEHEGSVLKPEAGTDPRVYYIREFGKTWK